MTVFEAVYLMLAFGTLIVLIMSDRNTKNK
ncbi:MAG: putative holin-like toxin [Defluviitaleaceae bacterium]|nr:putative holin-like toxin [Defluviitaleaceae bacterium]